MKHDRHIGIEDLVLNKFFRDWVLLKDPEAEAYWREWMEAHPEKTEIVNYSRTILYSLQADEEPISEEEIENEIKAFLQKAGNEPAALRTAAGEMRGGGMQRTQGVSDNQREGDEEPAAGTDETWRPVRQIWLKSGWWGRAGWKIAGILVLFVGGWWLWQREFAGKTGLRPSYESFIAHPAGLSREYVNGSDSAERIVLSDGSSVLLAGRTRLVFTQMYPDRREAYLEGEGFFEIIKNPVRPFYVYTRDITTKVLGTSFRVRAYATDQKIIVSVKTGKVSVYKSDEPGGTLVMPNQEAVYHKKMETLNKTLVEAPAEVTPTPKTEFDFDDTPLDKVFAVLQRAYGITIVFDEETMSSCTLSVSMGEETFYDKLKLICKTINASYEVIDGNIVINSKGCK